MDFGMGITSVISAVPVARAPATAKQALGGGTRDEPTTASASSSRLRNGNADPEPQATWRTVNAARALPVKHSRRRITCRLVARHSGDPKLRDSCTHSTTAWLEGHRTLIFRRPGQPTAKDTSGGGFNPDQWTDPGCESEVLHQLQMSTRERTRGLRLYWFARSSTSLQSSLPARLPCEACRMDWHRRSTHRWVR